ncbi:MAG TPA: hypothetical protein VF544_05550 [Pyrinomonadaceae bacterium]
MKIEFTLDEKNLQEKSASLSKTAPLGPTSDIGTEAGRFPAASCKLLILLA